MKLLCHTSSSPETRLLKLHYIVPDALKDRERITNFYKDDPRVLNFAVDVSASLNVYLEISCDDNELYTPPEITIDGILYHHDGCGDCCIKII
jgi:hypothetical protein